ncbi:membrane protein, partial [Fusobacterium necrophorum DAB]|uniref:autotransporter-associated N-terminal domain-containing protein n=1 Tax=Fusobacterium necrophorum TaxID=859 RepID=UPI00046203B6
MVKNQLREVEKNLRWIAKRNKNISFSIGLVLLYVMLGMNAFTEEVNTIVATKQEIGLSTDRLSEMLRRIKEENSKKLKGTQLELVQLMEQGDQVVKSPWSSWQFGINYFSNNGTGRYRGRGDKDKKYIFNGIYTRENWKVKNAMNIAASNGPTGSPITLGNENISSWQNANSDSSGGVTIEKDSSISSGTNGNRSWGLVDLRDLKEPINEIEILAHISPKEVTKQAISLDINVPTVGTLEAPVIDPKVNTPLDAPVIKTPVVEAVTINPLVIDAPEAPIALTAPVIDINIAAPSALNAPQVPSISVTPSSPDSPEAPKINIAVIAPTINALTIASPPTITAPTVVSPAVKPVDFVIDPSGDSKLYKFSNWSNSIPQELNVTALVNRDYVTLGTVTANVESPTNQVINVIVDNNRALVVDEAINGAKVTYRGNINLKKNQNVGIDLQGTHQGNRTAPAMLTVINAGTIVGEAKDGNNTNKEHIAFGFNNADASNNTTMSHMINQGTITLNAPFSAAIQLKPEDPHYWDPVNWQTAPLKIKNKQTSRITGRVLMKADNKNNLNINGINSFGVLTIFNEGVPKTMFDPSYASNHESLKAERLYDGERVLPGGEIGRSALSDSKYTSGIYNTGNINILGDNSIGVGLLQEIQEVKIAGNINIGTIAVTQENNISNSVGKKSDKVEEAVGIFAGAPTKPVKPGEKDTLIDDKKSGSTGNTATQLVGTETVEINGNIVLGEHAESSIGALVGDTEVALETGKENGTQKVHRKYKRSGDITAKENSVITIGGRKNYGLVVNNSAHSSKFGTEVDNLIYNIDKTKHGIGINKGTIDVKGKSSIGFAMIKGGNSSSSGKISVKENAEDSIGFYGKEDDFSNSGIIEVTSTKSKNKAIVLDGQTTGNKIIFNNTGNIYVNTSDNGNTNLNGKDNIGIYAQGHYKFDHSSGNIKAGKDAIAFYVKDLTGEVNINAPVELAASGIGTTIGFYSDGNAKVKFGTGSSLKIGTGAVGLYSSDTTKFKDTFKVVNNQQLNVDLGSNSTFGLLNGSTGTVNIGSYLKDNKINITNFGAGASLFYTTSGVKAILDENYEVTNGAAASTAILVGTNGSGVVVSSGKTVTTNTNVALIATKGSGNASTAKNEGTIVFKRDTGIAIYTEGSTGNNSGTVIMEKQGSVAILGENRSSLTNSGKIETLESSSAGIYGKDSDITNSGRSTNGIFVKKGFSAAICGLLESNADKTINNSGLIKLETTGQQDSAGIYAKLTSNTNKLITTNSGTIEVIQNKSAGVFAENTSTQAKNQFEVTNSGLVKVEGTEAVAIIGKKSKITNSGIGTNGIEIVENKSAAILATDNSEVINSGRIEGKTGISLVGISVDQSSTVTNSGTITMETASNTGISTKGGEVTNSKDIILKGENSAAISSENTNVTNSAVTGKIEINKENSVGIYTKLNNASTVNISNVGTISLLTPSGTSPNKSAAIYSLYDSTATGMLTTTNSGTINVGQEGSVGIFAKNVSTTQVNPQSIVTNSKVIKVTKQGSAGMLGEKSSLSNTGTGADGIELSANKTVGMIGNVGSTLTNSGRIETKTVTPENATEGLVGISLNASQGTNETAGTITLGTAYSTGIYGESFSTLKNKGIITSAKENTAGVAAKASIASNEIGANIIFSGSSSTGMFGVAVGNTKSTLTNSGTITGSGERTVGMAGNASTVTNKKTITLSGDSSTGIFGEAGSTLLNDTNGVITIEGESSVGIYSKSNTAIAKNAGTIKAENKGSAAMLGDESELENTGAIETKQEKSAGMYAKNTNATNKKSIVIDGKASAGILVKLDGKDKLVSGTNNETGNITVKNQKSAAMLGKIKSGTAGTNAALALTNSNNITIEATNSVGIMLTNESNITKDKVKATNTGTITLTGAATDKGNIGILASKKATGVNGNIINVNTKESIGMLAENESDIVNNKTITLTGKKGIGMLAKLSNSTAVNNDTINVNSKSSLGMLAKATGDVKNKKTIDVTAESGVGIFVSDTGKGENTTTGTIALENKNAVGIFAKNNNDQHTASNSGTIILGKADGSTRHQSLIGMFAQAENGKKASVKNIATGIININTGKSVGMYAKNDNANNIADVDLKNEGTVNINSGESAGIYAPKATISKVGKIAFKNTADTNGSSAVYVSEGGKVANTDSADINLGTVNQNRVAYYVNGANSSLAGTNIGKISGYGVGVYLQGNSNTDIAKIDGNTATLDYKTSGLSGDGIIGLYLNGDTKIEDYTKGIKVGNTVERNTGISGDKEKYAIGIYTNKQGVTGTPYKINTNITGGKNSVGIYVDNNSDIEYKGTMEIGDETTAGTGIFITKSTGGNTGHVKLAGNKGETTIKLKGTGGVAVIASEGTKFDGGKATIELVGTNIQGVGVYGKKGSTININDWTFNNNGNAAEEVRSEEGGAYIDADKNLKPRMVLTHVINGETAIANGKTVTAVADGTYEAKENIGLMGEGHKNPTAPAPLVAWKHSNFEIVNQGTIDFLAASQSTGIFARVARVKNDGAIKVGEASTAIYGIYDNTVRKYDGAPASSQNKLELETTENSKITLGNSSTGMYLINAEKITNKSGTIEANVGATKNVGIYVENGQDTTPANNKVLEMTTATKITLGDGSVGLYSKGTSDTVRNKVTNTGDISVGAKIVGAPEAPSVAIYSENTKLDTNSKISVGENGIAFFGKNAEININGGSVNFQNKGVLAYLENSTLVSKIGNLASTKNTMLYLKNSKAQLDGAGAKVNMDIADGYTGAYIEGKSELTGVQSIKLGENSIGLFLKDAEFTSNAEIIESTKDKAKGILATNSNLTNNSKVSLSGVESIGIYSNADATKSFVNNGEMTLSGKKTIGVLLKGAQSFENKANINIAASADSKEPTIGIYTSEGTSNIKHSSGTIAVGEKSVGIYSTANSNVEVTAGKIDVADQAIGVYKQNGKVILNGELKVAAHTASGKDTEPTGVYAVNGTEVNDNASNVTVEEKSYGFILNNTDSTKTNIYKSSNTGTVSMGNDSVFLYSQGKANITNNRNINSNGADRLVAFYIKNGGIFKNTGTLDFSNGKGNLGIYALGSIATNEQNGVIIVGKTDDIDPATGRIYDDKDKIVYGIGMAADNRGTIINHGNIYVKENKSMGMYGSGEGTRVENHGKIFLDGSKATDVNKIQSMTGVYVDNGATFINRGDIKTTDSYAGRDGKVNENVSGLTGVVVMNGSTLENHGKIYIDADNSSGVVIRGKKDTTGKVVRYAVIKNYGEIKVRGKGITGISWKDVNQADIDELQKQINSKIISDPSGHEIGQASGTDKDYEGVKITVKDGKPTFSRNGQPVSEKEIAEIEKLIGPNLSLSDIGFYVDTLGRTKPMDIDGGVPPINSQLIVGTEYSEKTNAKQWFVKDEVIKPFLNQIQGRNFKLTSLAGSLTWMATPVLDNHGEIVGIAMAKISYTSFTDKTENTYNFSDGLEQRYDMNSLSSTEKQIFNKLNGVGKNEQALLVQAFDEMMGHQYANVQQRIQATASILDKELKYLKKEWDTKSKDSNKIKAFGMRGEYKTDTAGVIDYSSHAKGVAYLHEKETAQLGNTTGW